MTSRDRERALLAVLDGLYAGLGEAAGVVELDGATIALYDASRTVGGAALAWRERLGDGSSAPLDAVVAALDAAARGERSGRLALATVTTLVGPRVLVSLRDAREAGDLDEAGRAASGVASDAVVAAIRRCAEAAAALGAGDGSALDGFADLARTLDEKGFGESFR